ncbi:MULTISPECIES: hypothetical protein [Mesorhizobium]|uniref:Cysteine rich repeat-containing protein n=1 Tax=Mesorhizobium opportunistum (strain LMG 24607 / HAMBI 3007 / WSM2075) TaxID=536019 RepID=F7Y6W4_MESOW|nr:MULTISPECIES: hypothetical protein [Mesorhizobium]AEH87434.1 conserved hypothetical protein [Mesorhizobium opportunistum WSM2075]MCA0030269.1 hypothetical protein [Mesorhizobium sp. B263B2A]
MQNQTSFQLAFFASISFFVTDVALAKDATKTPCRADALRVCHMANEIKAQGCLKQHLSEITPACKAFLTKK